MTSLRAQRGSLCKTAFGRFLFWGLAGEGRITGAVGQTQEGPVVDLTPGDLAFEAFGNGGQCLLEGPFIHLAGFILQAQCPQRG